MREQLKEGPHVVLVLTRVNGYGAECERTYFTVEPSPQVPQAFGAMCQARYLAFGKVRPGVSCAELDCAVNDFLQKEGYSGEDVRLHRTGHGFGLGNHEAPWIAEGILRQPPNSVLQLLLPYWGKRISSPSAMGSHNATQYRKRVSIVIGGLQSED